MTLLFPNALKTKRTTSKLDHEYANAQEELYQVLQRLSRQNKLDEPCRTVLVLREIAARLIFQWLLLFPFVRPNRSEIWKKNFEKIQTKNETEKENMRYQHTSISAGSYCWHICASEMCHRSLNKTGQMRTFRTMSQNEAGYTELLETDSHKSQWKSNYIFNSQTQTISDHIITIKCAQSNKAFDMRSKASSVWCEFGNRMSLYLDSAKIK